MALKAVATRRARMKDAGRKAALTRAEKGIGRTMALKAAATRRARAETK